MALRTRRRSVLLQLLLVVALALTAAFSCADAARAPATLEVAEAAAPDRGQALAGSGAVPVEHVVVVDKRGGGGGHGYGGHSSGHGGGGHSSGEEGGGGSIGGSRGAGTGYYGGHGSGRGYNHNSAPGGRDGVWKVGVAAAVLAASCLT